MSINPREFIFEKSLAILPVFIGIIIGDLNLFILAAIFLGQGHFTLSYIYKIRSGRIRPASFLLWFAVAAAMFFVFSDPERHTPLLLITSIYLVTHFVVDDRYLIGSPVSKYATLEMGIVLLLYYALIVQTLYGGPIPMVFTAMAGIGLGHYFWTAHRETAKKDIYNWFFLSQIFLLILLVASGRHFDTGWINAGAGIYHYAVWYIAYGRKVKENANARKTYLGWVLVVNLVIGVLFTVHLVNPAYVPVLDFAFTQQYFLIWAFLHFFSATRIDDIRHITQVKWRLSSA